MRPAPSSGETSVMQAGIILGWVALLAWLGGGFASQRLRTGLATRASASLPPPTTTTTDATEVFQRAFWKRPTSVDKSRHAERREWADGNGAASRKLFLSARRHRQ